VLRSRRPVLEEAWGAAAKLRIKLRHRRSPLAARRRHRVTWMTKRSPLSLQADCSKPASTAATVVDLAQAGGLGRIRAWPSQPKLLLNCCSWGPGSALDHHLNGVRQAANLELQRPDAGTA